MVEQRQIVPFDQHRAAARARDALNRLNEVCRGHNKASELYKKSLKEFYAALDAAYPASFGIMCDELKRGDSSQIHLAIQFLIDDPWFFRSGYVKADLIRYICKLRLDKKQMRTLAAVVVRAIDTRDRREFRSYCKLARFVDSADLRAQIAHRAKGSDPNVARRALWVLRGLEQQQCP